MNDTNDKTEKPDATVIDPQLVASLICPVSRQKLVYDEVNNELVSRKARLAYPIRGGIPLMLLEEARDLDLTPQPMPASMNDGGVDD